jgi:hypothetical protein
VIVSVQEITDGGDVEPFELGCDGAVCDVAKDSREVDLDKLGGDLIEVVVRERVVDVSSDMAD